MASSCQNDQGLGSRREVEVKAMRRRKNSRSTARTPDQATPAKLTTNTIQYRRPKSSGDARAITEAARDRKSTRLNSSHITISYAVFCLKKKKKSTTATHPKTPTAVPTDLAPACLLGDFVS